MDPTVRTIGRGLLAAPTPGTLADELGMIGLTDQLRRHLVSLDLTGVPDEGPVTLTAVLLPRYGRATPGFEIAVHRLGAGTPITDADTSGGSPSFIGLRGDEGATLGLGGIVPLLLGEYVQLEVRPGITGCECGGTSTDQLAPAPAQARS